MSIHSKKLLFGINQLNKLNLDNKIPFHELTDLFVAQQKHKKDVKVTELIHNINQKTALSVADEQIYQKAPLSYIGKGLVIGIRNEHHATYRIIRAEHYKGYSLLCKSL